MSFFSQKKITSFGRTYMYIFSLYSRKSRFGFETSRFQNFSNFLVVSDSLSKNFGIEKTIGFGIVKFWYQKKYWILYRKNLVSEKVFDSVSFRFWVFLVTFRFRNFLVSKLFNFLDGFGIERIWFQKKYRIRYRKNLVSDSVSEKFGIKKSFGFGFVQILGIVIHCYHSLPIIRREKKLKSLSKSVDCPRSDQAGHPHLQVTFHRNAIHLF